MNGIPLSLIGRGWHALKLAGQAYRLSRTDREKVAHHARRYLAESMGELRGLPQKIGQILSMAEGAGAAEFAPLRGRAEPLAFPIVEKVLTAEWKRPWRDLLASIEPRGWAASLGQVHRGELLDGTPVAIKVQYPGIAKALEADLKLLGWLSLPVGGLGRGFDLAAYREEILRDFTEELDYRQEADHQQRYGQLAQAMPNTVVPRIFRAHCTSRVLVNGWEEGTPLEEAAREWSASDRKAAGKLFLGHTLETLFLHGFTQGDLHPGNFRFRSNGGDPQLVLYDFGCIYRPALATRLALLKLIEISEANTRGDPYPYFIGMGFDPAYLEPLADKLAPLSRALFEPFLRVGPYDLDRWQLGPKVGDILGEDRWNFRIAAPADLILLMRIFHGLLHTLRTLGVPLSWSAALAPIREHFRRETQNLDLPLPERAERGFGRMAKHVMIQVREDGKTKVRLTSPIHTIDNLGESMDQGTMDKIRERGIDLDRILKEVRAGGYRPQQVFRLDAGRKEVRVWLE